MNQEEIMSEKGETASQVLCLTHGAHGDSSTSCYECRKTTREKLARLVEALNRIACWNGGPVVKGSFDEPHSATIAREALSSVGER